MNQTITCRTIRTSGKYHHSVIYEATSKEELHCLYQCPLCGEINHQWCTIVLKERDTKSNDLACDKVEKAAALARESLCDLENRNYEDLVSTEIICVCDHCLQPAPWAQRGEKADRSWVSDLVICVIMIAVMGLLWALLEPVPFFISICALFTLAILFSFIFRKKVLARIRSKKARKVKEKMGDMPPLFGESASALQAQAEKTEAYRAVQIPKIR